jgi:probable rRNA maturation factor
MTIEVTNTSGQLVPTTEMVSLMTHAMNALELNPECDLNISFVEDEYMTELHIKWMNEPMFCPFLWICLNNQVKL